MVIVDNLGIEHSLHLDSMEFIVQKKAEMACSHISELMRNHQIEDAKKALFSIWHLMASITYRGYDDHDMNMETNFGFIDGEAVKIDVGPLKKTNG